MCIITCASYMLLIGNQMTFICDINRHCYFLIVIDNILYYHREIDILYWEFLSHSMHPINIQFQAQTVQ